MMAAADVENGSDEMNNYYDNAESFMTNVKQQDGLSDDIEEEEVDDNESLNFRRRSSEDNIKGRWDVFRKENVEISNTDEDEFLLTINKIVKFLAYVFTFLLVASSSVVAKGTLLFMTSQIRSGQSTSFCSYPIEYPDKHYQVTLDAQEQAQWIWAIFFTFVVPEFFTFVRSIRICLFKSQKRPTFNTTVLVTVIETLHTIGIAMLLLVALPELDAVKGIMLTNCVCLVPGIMGLLSRQAKEDNRTLKIALDIAAIVAQVTGLFVWPIALRNKLSHGFWAIPLGVILVSFRWWENYADSRSPYEFVQYLSKAKKELSERRYYIYIFTSVWKVLVFFLCMLGFAYITSDKTGYDRFPFLQYFFTIQGRTLDVTALNQATIPIQHFQLESIFGTVAPYVATTTPTTPTTTDTSPVLVIPSAALVTFAIQAIAAAICYTVAKFSCRICIQSIGYSLPISLTTPVTICLLIAMCGIKTDDVCFLRNIIPRYLFWECPSNDYFGTFIAEEQGWIWILWLLSQTWITLHIWISKDERLANTDKLFVAPMYNGILIDQCLALNRRRDEDEDVETKELDEGPAEVNYEARRRYMHAKDILGAPGMLPSLKPTDKIPKIIACATMWHETDDEMVKMLKSIMKMDEDQSARKTAQHYFQLVDPDYYTFEAHIFFDDAFEKSYAVYQSQKQLTSIRVNQFVKSLIRQVQEAAKKVHNQNAKVKKPSAILTPYGGRLMWILPGGNKLVAHLKDKDYIRHRKRWSQVMYMYYLLGHKIMDTEMEDERKDATAENTFLLALDGDIDFTPKSVLLLVDLMKAKRNVGAACGRIHPIGSGMMVWYQKFEYAIGHWMQKATEHVIGCVLCSPGCFSLFRAKALMAPNVMKTYTTKPTEARHYVQYDQGEDRWLCTLVLQQGYRVEYSAAADAYTQCPEGFKEFFVQRRRWIPSTMANILDLLENAKQTVDINDNISTLYITYQAMMMVGTVLGPGTIFLMLVGAFNAAFNIDNVTALEINLVPVILFILICFLGKEDHQILFAQILTAIYAMIMMAVIVSIILQIIQEGIMSPSSFFSIAMATSTVAAALFHPMEFHCVVYGWIYWLVIPSMYLLLMIYSLMNMNNVSWGTREVIVVQAEETPDDAKTKKSAEVATAKQNGILGFLGKPTNDNSEGCLNINLPNLCSFMCCTHPKPREEQFQLLKIQETLDGIVKRLDNAERGTGAIRGIPRRPSMIRSHSKHDLLLPLLREEEDTNGEFSEERSTEIEEQEEDQVKIEYLKEDPMEETFWVDDLGKSIGHRGSIAPQEVEFFQGLIQKYLHPLEVDNNQKKVISQKLIELRNLVVFAYFMLNAIFVLLLFILQLHKDQIYMNWPIGEQTTITFDEDNDAISITFKYQHLEPVGFMFVVFFALVIVIQFTAMLVHRFATFTHILSTTHISCNKETSGGENVNSNDVVKVVRELQRLSGVDETNWPKGDAVSDRGAYKRKNTIFNLAQTSRNSKPKINDLSTAFRHRMMSLKPEDGPEASPVGNRALNVRRGTINALIQRRNSLYGGPPPPPPQRSSFSAHSRPSISGHITQYAVDNEAYEE